MIDVIKSLQIDAAINPGNSGGPAFANLQSSQVAGVAFSKLHLADNVGWDLCLLSYGRHTFRMLRPSWYPMKIFLKLLTSSLTAAWRSFVVFGTWQVHNPGCDSASLPGGV